MTLMPHQCGVVLVRTSDRNVAAKARFKRAAQALQAHLDDAEVVAAYLVPGPTGNDVAFGAAVEGLVARGAVEIVVVPYDVEWPYPELYDIPDVLDDLAGEYPGVRFRLAGPLGVDSDLTELLAGRLEAARHHPPAGAASPREVAVIAGQTPITTGSLKDGEVPKLPAYRHHVFVCAGRRCLESGSADTYRALSAALAARGLDGGDEGVKLSRSKCLSPCQAAPVALCYPAGTYVARLDAETVPSFVDRVLLGGGSLPGRAFKAGE